MLHVKVFINNISKYTAQIREYPSNTSSSYSQSTSNINNDIVCVKGSYTSYVTDMVYCARYKAVLNHINVLRQINIVYKKKRIYL